MKYLPFDVFSRIFNQVTILACFICKWRMHHVFEQLRRSGHMRRVTVAAIHDRGVDMQMGIGKGFGTVVVAATAQGLYGQLHQGRLRGLMRPVTASALVDFPGRMHVACLFQRLDTGALAIEGSGDRHFASRAAGNHRQFRMAGNAQIRIFGQQQVLQSRPVRVVAGAALSIHRRRVTTDHRLGLWLQIGSMAGMTEKTLLARKHPRNVAAVDIVAFQTAPLGEGRMVEFFRRRLHHLCVAGFAKIRISGLGGQKPGLGGPVGPVAGIALTGQYRFMRIAFGKLHFGIDMTAVTDHVHPVLDHAGVIGPVWIVTAAAIAFLEGWMRNRGGHGIAGVRVAG